MSKDATDDLTAMLSTKMAALVGMYELKLIRVDSAEALLVGNNYALRFTADLDALDVEYIERSSHGQLCAYTLRHLVMQRFTPEDRAQYGHPASIKERLMASLSVYASGLANRCGDVLSGEKSWLRKEAWASGEPGAATQQLLQHELLLP